MSVIFRYNNLHCSSNICKFFFIVHPVTCKTVPLGEVVIILCYRQVEAVLFLLVQTGKQTVKDMIIALIWHLTGGENQRPLKLGLSTPESKFSPSPLFFTLISTHHQCFMGLGKIPLKCLMSWKVKQAKQKLTDVYSWMVLEYLKKKIYVARLRAYIIFHKRKYALIGEKDGHPRLRPVFLLPFRNSFNLRSVNMYWGKVQRCEVLPLLRRGLH